jgi:hypothetical protein
MSSKTIDRRMFLLLLPGAALAGCGGAGTKSAVTLPSGAAAGPATRAGMGHVSVTVNWTGQNVTAPATRHIPIDASSLFLQLTSRADGTVYSLVISRRNDKPGTQTAAFNELIPIGDYVLACAARSQDLGLGDTLAVAAANVTVVDGQTANVPLVLVSVITRLILAAIEAKRGQTFLIYPSGTDSANQIVKVSGADFDYTFVSGGDRLQPATNNLGAFTAVAVGSSRVRVALKDKPAVFVDVNVNITGTADIAFTPPATVFIGYPVQLTATQVLGTDPETGVSPNFVFESLNPDKATITPNGLVTGLAPGDLSIRVTATGGQIPVGQTIVRTYNTPVVRLSSFTINGPSTATVGQSVTLTPNFNFDAIYYGSRDIVWSIVDGGVYATIDPASGVFQPRSSGPGDTGAHAVKVHAVFPPTGQTAELVINVSSFGGVNVGVQ